MDKERGNQGDQQAKPDSGMPGGGAGRIDEVGRSGVYPMSHDEDAPPDAQTQGMASWGQGDRGAAGYEDSGGSELTDFGREKALGGWSPGPAGTPGADTDATGGVASAQPGGPAANSGPAGSARMPRPPGTVEGTPDVTGEPGVESALGRDRAQGELPRDLGTNRPAGGDRPDQR